MGLALGDVCANWLPLVYIGFPMTVGVFEGITC